MFKHRYQNVLILCVASLLLLGGCSKPKKQGDDKGPAFTVLCSVRTTPVKDQGKSSLCWAYGMLATSESEHIMKGDSINLSPTYVMRNVLWQEGDRCFFTRGGRRMVLSGVMPMLVHYLQTDGIIPYDSYFNGDKVPNCKVLVNKIEHAAKASSYLGDFNDRMRDLLDKELGYLPRIVAMGGAEYTPKEFAHSVCMPDEYVFLTSFTHHPYYTPFALEVPDNAMHDAFYNLPLDTLMDHIEKALFSSHPVCWEGDISEPGFDWKNGMATIDMPEGQDVVRERQMMFETRQTTDDHVMELVGIVRDIHGNRYFVAKNSWGRSNRRHGYIFLSEPYVRLKTIAVAMSQSAFTIGKSERK